MNKREGTTLKTKTAIVFLSGSAGELDWILPILDHLLKREFDLKIIFLTKHVLASVKTNSMLNDYIHQENSKIELIFLGSYLWEMLERISYLAYRFLIKYNLKNKNIIQPIYSIFEKILETLFMHRLSLRIGNLKNNQNVIFSEYPALRRPRDKWVYKQFNDSIFSYCPHSPHVYTEDLERNYDKSEGLDLDKSRFLLMGHPGDYFVLNDNRELASNSLEKVFIGHPKYSDSWLHDLQEKSKKFRRTSETRKNINILVLSRGSGSYLDDQSHKSLVENTIDIVQKNIPNYNFLIKKHPREFNSYWDNFLNDDSINIVNDHILNLATQADLAISFWTSGAMDCHTLGVPVIEYFDPNQHPKQQVKEGNSYTTIYRKLGVVLPANNRIELERSLLRIVEDDYEIPLHKSHKFYNELITNSNQWFVKIEKILQSRNLIENLVSDERT